MTRPQTLAARVLAELGDRATPGRGITIGALLDSTAGEYTLRLDPRRRTHRGVTHVRIADRHGEYTVTTWRVKGHDSTPVARVGRVSPRELRALIEALCGISLGPAQPAVN
jgi:hypothetical protein